MVMSFISLPLWERENYTLEDPLTSGADPDTHKTLNHGRPEPRPAVEDRSRTESVAREAGILEDLPDPADLSGINSPICIVAEY
jgi:hypothetical protein